jgi:GNAT superfamily N-acetyltransferase
MLAADEGDGAPAWVAERGGHGDRLRGSGPPRDDDVPLPAAEIYAIYVDPDAWRRGAGRALMPTAVDHWLAGRHDAVLWVLEANSPGRAFYEALGWRLRTAAARRSTSVGSRAPEIRYRLTD